MTAPVILESGALLRAVVLVAIAAGVSVALRLDLERRMLWAAVRATVQLFLVGEILSTLFNNPWAPATFLAMAVMIGAATHQTIVRPERRLPGGGLGAFITLALTGLLTTWIVARGVIGVVPWYTPQYAIPLLGMILGNGLTGMALTLDRMTAAAHEHRARHRSRSRPRRIAIRGDAGTDGQRGAGWRDADRQRDDGGRPGGDSRRTHRPDP